MTPEKLRAARVRAQAAGDTAAVEEIDALLAEVGVPTPAETTPRVSALDAVRPFAEGFSQGSMGELQGVLAGPQNQQITEERRQAFGQQYPKTAFGLDMLGSAAGAMLLPGAGTIQQGAILGGVQGAMRADPGDRDLGGLMGAAAGAALSWAGPKLLGGVSDAMLKRVPPQWIDRVRGALGKRGDAERAYARGVELGQARAAQALFKEEPARRIPSNMNTMIPEPDPRILPSPKALAAELKDMNAIDRHALRVGLLKTLGDQIDEATFSGSTPSMDKVRNELIDEMTPIIKAAFKGTRKGGDVISAFENKIKAFSREPTRTSIQLGRMSGTLGGRAHVPTPSDIRWPRIPLGQTGLTNAVQRGGAVSAPGAGGLLTPTFLDLMKARNQGQ